MTDRKPRRQKAPEGEPIDMAALMAHLPSSKPDAAMKSAMLHVYGKSDDGNARLRSMIWLAEHSPDSLEHEAFLGCIGSAMVKGRHA